MATRASWRYFIAARAQLGIFRHSVAVMSQSPSPQLNLLRAVIGVALPLLLCGTASGIDTDRNIKQLYHTSWTAKDGAPTQTTGITRTSDGYLWLASRLGLVRFNGLRFESYEPPPGISFPSYSILNLIGTRDGGLWVSFEPSGAAYIRGNHVQVYDQAGLELHSFVEDLDGRVWATTLTSLR